VAQTKNFNHELGFLYAASGASKISRARFHTRAIVPAQQARPIVLDTLWNGGWKPGAQPILPKVAILSLLILKFRVASCKEAKFCL